MNETDPEQLSIPERLKLVEASLEVQGEILISIQAELIESERLTESIGRLGEGAGSLSAALLQVDRQQQTLTRLGRELQTVKDESITGKDVEEKVTAAKELVEARQRTVRKKLMRGLVGVLVLAAIIAFASVQYLQAEKTRRIANCERNAATNAAVVKFLNTVAGNSQVPKIKQSAQDVIDALPSTDEVRLCS